MSQTVRYILFIAISMAIIFAWQVINPPPPVERPSAKQSAPAEEGAPAPAKPPPTPVAGHEEEPEEPRAPEATVVQTGLWTATFTTEGAALSSFELLGKKQRRHGERSDEQVNLVHPAEGQAWPLATEIGPDSAGFGPKANYRLAERGEDRVVFERTRGPMTVVKTYTWTPDTYRLHLDVSVRGAEAPLPVNLIYPAYEEPKESGGFFNFAGRPEIHQPVCHLANAGRSVETHSYSAKEPEKTFGGVPSYVGMDEKYFISAMSPVGDTQDATCTLRASAPGTFTAVLSRGLPPGGSNLRYDLFLGPKDVDQLIAADHGLEDSVDFGFFTVISRVLLTILRAFNDVLHNWGVAIIALTVLVKLLTFPLTHKQMKSMEEMRKLAPKMEAIKAKHAGDQQRINQETMKLYKEHNVQPLGGCLPMLIQMPVWFALYSTLSTSFELYNEPFIQGWIGDLTVKDPYYIMPVLMTVTMVLTQWLTPQPAANQQMKVMMYAMPAFFGFIMMSLPAGLVLYIFTNNLLSIAQSLWFRRRYGHAATTAVAR